MKSVSGFLLYFVLYYVYICKQSESFIMHQKNENGTFTSKIGFVLAAVGSAVGMATSGCSLTAPVNTAARLF